ncbi:MAG: hypothetical protein ABSH06_14275 [Thermodesulfobacteriota bacterium]|jgi:hypothetical protein
MKDNLAGKTSDEVKAMLMNTPGSSDSDEQDFESPGYEVGPSEDVEEPVLRQTIDEKVSHQFSEFKE